MYDAESVKQKKEKHTVAHALLTAGYVMKRSDVKKVCSRWKCAVTGITALSVPKQLKKQEINFARHVCRGTGRTQTTQELMQEEITDGTGKIQGFSEGNAMRRKDALELAETPGAVLVAEIVPEGNKYYIRLMGVHYKISSKQFEYLIDSGIFCTKYRIDTSYMMGFEMQVYERR